MSFASHRSFSQCNAFAHKGLIFLHDHNIVHRVRLHHEVHSASSLITLYQDISYANMLVNHYSSDLSALKSLSRSGWRHSDVYFSRVKYCLMDFNLSLILPDGVRRLPSRYAFVGCCPFHPLDICAGEYDYDPYAFDVGCLGNAFAESFDVSPDNTCTRQR